MTATTVSDTIRQLLSLDAAALKTLVLQATPRIAAAGNWPAWIDQTTSLADRIPAENTAASGFDAGIACALGIMPTAVEKLSATLHAAYTPAAVADVRGAITQNGQGLWTLHSADSPACWWLAACSLCMDGEFTDLPALQKQITQFGDMHADAALRLQAAEKTLNAMCASFDTRRGYAYGSQDGCMQGAYIAGHDMAVMHAAHYGVYFIGTFHESLGLEDFIWGDSLDDKGRAKSGPIHGSKQFVKCADEAELTRAIESIRLPLPPRPSAA